ncbi:hypothetical protein GN316_19165 [Xylophilus sp. Kf1]|nr:hypothetical protein [Xylophilus sp. Kf1]
MSTRLAEPGVMPAAGRAESGRGDRGGLRIGRAGNPPDRTMMEMQAAGGLSGLGTGRDGRRQTV